MQGAHRTVKVVFQDLLCAFSRTFRDILIERISNMSDFRIHLHCFFLVCLSVSTQSCVNKDYHYINYITEYIVNHAEVCLVQGGSGELLSS